MDAQTPASVTGPAVAPLDHVVIRFAGDSGDGVQVTGKQFTATAAAAGNDLATFPDYPAEIRAPAGSLAGVSGFQIHFSSEEVHTPGDAPDALVAMNPAALKVNIADLKPNGILVVNADGFKEADLARAGYATDPLADGSLGRYRVIKVEMTRLVRAALRDTGIPQRNMDRCKNFFALGMMYYLYRRPLDVSLRWIEEKFAGKPGMVEANRLALTAGFRYCEAAEVFEATYEVPAARLPRGTYRNVSGNEALALGLVAASRKSGLRLFQGSYPITPASDILHELSTRKNFGVITFQAEDEIAAIGAAIGASFAGALAVTTTSGPGLALKSESIGLAVMVELPIVIVDVQRGGPSTGLPTKTEQADLLLALHGRHSEAPCIVIAARSPADCFDAAYEACRLTVAHMTPVILLSDGTIANGSEPWRVPRAEDLPAIPARFRTERDGFLPYSRDPRTLARPWAIPGTPGLEHRIGGLEKSEGAGSVSYDPLNHERMVGLRQEKISRVAGEIPAAAAEGDREGRLLVIGWGSTYGAIAGAVARARATGKRVGHLHLRYLNPLAPETDRVLSRFERILVPEVNSGQLAFVLRGRYLRDVISMTKIRGMPFREDEILARILELA